MRELLFLAYLGVAAVCMHFAGYASKRLGWEETSLVMAFMAIFWPIGIPLFLFLLAFKAGEGRADKEDAASGPGPLGGDGDGPKGPSA